MMKIYLLKRLSRILIVSLLFLILSCSVGPKANSNSQLKGVSEKFYTSFYKEDGNTVYYIKPIEFESNKEELFADITFLQNTKSIENVVINFSLFSKTKINLSEINSIAINNYQIKDYKILYNEPKSSKLFETRFTATYPSSNFSKNYSDLYFTIEINSISKKYIPNKKSLKVLKNIGLLFN